MPSVYDLKPRFQGLLRPVMRRLAGAGVTPNAVTLTSVLGSVGVGAVLIGARERPLLLLLLPAWLFLRMALNAIDGMMARELRLATPLGAVLNELGDLLSDVGLYLPLAWVAPGAGPAVVIFCFGALLTEFCGVLSQALGAGRQYQGPTGKSDRAFVVGALGFGTGLFPAVFAAWPWVFWLLALGTLVTCRKRLLKALG